MSGSRLLNKSFKGFIVLLLVSCSGAGVFQVHRHFSTPPDSLQDYDRAAMYQDLEIESDSVIKERYLKVHMDDGDLYVLKPSTMLKKQRAVKGTGYLLNPGRDTVSRGQFKIGVDSVAIMETNDLSGSAPFTGMMIYTGASLSLSGYCAARPKACFGSCPTFYSTENGEVDLKAEGFSSSFAPSLEESDIDALPGVQAEGNRVTLTMKNEALETHVVRRVDLLAVPKSSSAVSVLKDTKGNFWEISRLQEVDECQSKKGSCRSKVKELDGNEYNRPANAENLMTPETLNVRFDVENMRRDSLAMVIGQRQSLMSTFLFYQALDYMGSDVGRWFAMLERTASLYENQSFLRDLRGIKVQMRRSDHTWKTMGRIQERGPLAIDLQLIRIPPGSNPSAFRLKMVQGNYRIDYVALAGLDQQVREKRVQPRRVLRNGKPVPEVKRTLRDSGKVLTTLPGREYQLRYRLPDQQDYVFFLDSKGYYIEWMRPPWLKQSKPEKLTELIYHPEKALRDLAPVYKKIEPKMRKIFWNSRYANPSY